jgi:WD40 repeat protein
VVTVAINPSSTVLASGGDDKQIKLWNLNTKAEICTLSEHQSYVMSLAFSPDGKFLASGSHDRTIKIWQQE